LTGFEMRAITLSEFSRPASNIRKLYAAPGIDNH
jgi:hypothetical protein